MSQSTSMEVANLINWQIGHQARMMMGAKNPVGSEDSLTLKIGRGAKGSAGFLKVTLDPNDTYTVETIRVRKLVPTVVEQESGIYADQIHESIERITGFFLKL